MMALRSFANRLPMGGGVIIIPACWTCVPSLQGLPQGASAFLDLANSYPYFEAQPGCSLLWLSNAEHQRHFPLFLQHFFFFLNIFYKKLFTLQLQQTVYLSVCQPHGHWPMFAKFEKMSKEGTMTVSSWAPPVKVSTQTFKEGRRREGWVISSLALLTATLFGGNNKFLLRVLSDPNSFPWSGYIGPISAQGCNITTNETPSQWGAEAPTLFNLGEPLTALSIITITGDHFLPSLRWNSERNLCS